MYGAVLSMNIIVVSVQVFEYVYANIYARLDVR